MRVNSLEELRNFFAESAGCTTCKHFFDLHLDFSGECELCSVGKCFLCAGRRGSCSKREEGAVPEGKVKGADLEEDDE